MNETAIKFALAMAREHVTAAVDLLRGAGVLCPSVLCCDLAAPLGRRLWEEASAGEVIFAGEPENGSAVVVLSTARAAEVLEAAGGDEGRRLAGLMRDTSSYADAHVVFALADGLILRSKFVGLLVRFARALGGIIPHPSTGQPILVTEELLVTVLRSLFASESALDAHGVAEAVTKLRQSDPTRAGRVERLLRNSPSLVELGREVGRLLRCQEVPVIGPSAPTRCG